MARNNLGRLFTSISPKLSTPPTLSSSFAKSGPVFSNSVSRLISSSSSTQHQQEPRQAENSNKPQEESVKANHGKEDEEVEEDDDDFVNKQTGEVGGPRGPEPTRYGDWERNGRCYDF